MTWRDRLRDEGYRATDRYPESGSAGLEILHRARKRERDRLDAMSRAERDEDRRRHRLGIVHTPDADS